MSKEIEAAVIEGKVIEPEVTYSSNNSGGYWWLHDQDWLNLEAAGWKVDWYKDMDSGALFRTGEEGRWLGALASGATRKGLTLTEAVAEWESITGLSADEAGCRCCGQPHSFWDENNNYY